MCGRFSSTSQLQFLLEQFRAEPMGVEGHQPSWNVAPASDILVVTASAEGARQLRALKWGLVMKRDSVPLGSYSGNALTAALLGALLGSRQLGYLVSSASFIATSGSSR